MESAREAVDERFEGFARNTLEYMREERDLLFGGAGLPELSHSLAGRHVLVVVRGYGYREDLAALRSYIRDVRSPCSSGWTAARTRCSTRAT